MFDWTFQLGSCAMKAFPFYLYSFQIFNTMESRPADFMIWMGDHVYMLKPWQWNSRDNMPSGMTMIMDQTMPVLNFSIRILP